MNGKRMWGVAAIVTLAICVATSDLRAQSLETDFEVRVQRAGALAQHGRQLAAQTREFEEASSVLREAAELRGGGAEAVRDLIDAGYYAYYGGKGLRAVSALRAAGEAALEEGEMLTAAEAFLNAAWVAHREGELPTARYLFARGQRLMQLR